MAEPKTPEKDNERGGLHIAGRKIFPGTLDYVEIPVARLPTGSWLPLHVVAVHGRRRGPTIWLSAAVHGDELNGIPIIREVLQNLDARRLSGTVLAVPIVNVFGLIMESRYLPDRRDLNRSFPGSPRGSLAAQLAHLFMTHIVRRCHFGIDFHTGSDGRTNLPHVRCHVDDVEVQRLATVFGAPVVLHANPQPGSLRSAAQRLGIKTLLYEAGEALRFDRNAIQTGVEGTLRVMNDLGMIDIAPTAPSHPPIVSRRSTWIRARRGGLCRMDVALGEHVAMGQRIAVIMDSIGREDVGVRARTDGVVIGYSDHALLNRGDAVVHIAEAD